jgi:hypothetical protein
MSTISTNDDPKAAIDGGVELTEAVIGAIAGKLSAEPSNNPNPAQDAPNLTNSDWETSSQDWQGDTSVQQAPALKDSELIPALLEKVPEDLRDTITIQVGSKKVLKPGMEPNLNADQAKTLRTLLDDPSKVTGTVKMSDDGGNHFLKVSAGEVCFDTLGILPKQAETISVSPEPVNIAPEAVTENAITPTVDPQAVVEKAIAPGVDQQALVDAISRLESRVAELEQRISQKPFKLGNPQIGAWINGIRDNLATKLHQATDKISERVHEMADKIAVTTTEKVNEIKDSVTEKVDDIKQNVAETVSDIRENVTDGLELVHDVAANTVHEVIDAGMERHNQAVAKVNDTAQNIADGVKQTVSDPSQTFLDKVANPVVQRMIEIAEKIPNRVSVDEQGTKSLNVGTYQYQQSQTGEISINRAGEKVTAANLNQADVAAIQESKQVTTPKQTEQIKQAQKIEPPKPKMKVTV